MVVVVVDEVDTTVVDEDDVTLVAFVFELAGIEDKVVVVVAVAEVAVVSIVDFADVGVGATGFGCGNGFVIFVVVAEFEVEVVEVVDNDAMFELGDNRGDEGAATAVDGGTSDGFSTVVVVVVVVVGVIILVESTIRAGDVFKDVVVAIDGASLGRMLLLGFSANQNNDLLK